jgi:hypothetical protein
MLKNQERSSVAVLLLFYLICCFGMSGQQSLSVTGFEPERNASPYPFHGTGYASPLDLCCARSKTICPFEMRGAARGGPSVTPDRC